MTMTNGPTNDPTNADQAAAWDGREGAYWAEHAGRYDRAVADLHVRLLAATGVLPGERVLDVGCGTGQVTRDAGRAGAAAAVGIDLSTAMLEVARDRAAAEGLANVDFLLGDAQVHPFEDAAFDVVVSRTGAMFFGDPVAAFRNIGRALRPSGRMVLVTWRGIADNEWMRELAGALSGGRALPTPPPGAPGPFSCSDPVRVRSVLESSGFVDVGFEAVDADMWFGDAAEDAAAFVVGQLGWMLDGLAPAERTEALAELHASVTAHQGARGVTYGCGAWIISATRR